MHVSSSIKMRKKRWLHGSYHYYCTYCRKLEPEKQLGQNKPWKRHFVSEEQRKVEIEKKETKTKSCSSRFMLHNIVLLLNKTRSILWNSYSLVILILNYSILWKTILINWYNSGTYCKCIIKINITSKVARF